MCDSYNEIDVNPLHSNELIKFDIEKINKEIEVFSFGCQVQGYDIVSIKDDIKLLVWEDGNTEKSFCEYRLENIKQEWIKK